MSIPKSRALSSRWTENNRPQPCGNISDKLRGKAKTIYNAICLRPISMRAHQVQQHRFDKASCLCSVTLAKQLAKEPALSFASSCCHHIRQACAAIRAIPFSRSITLPAFGADQQLHDRFPILRCLSIFLNTHNSLPSSREWPIPFPTRRLPAQEQSTATSTDTIR